MPTGAASMPAQVGEAGGQTKGNGLMLSETTSKVTWGAISVAVSLAFAVSVSVPSRVPSSKSDPPAAAADPSDSALAPAHAPSTSRRTGKSENAVQRLMGGVIECTSKKPRLARALTRDIARALAGRASRASIALYDRSTRTSCAYRADKHYDSASIVKPIVLGALLHARGEGLSEEEQDLARKMIVNSDNESTYVLWDMVGPDSIQDFLDEAGMMNTTIDEAGFMGLTQVTARDQATLLELLTGEDDAVLDEEERAYILDLMRDVQEDQRWGAPAGAPSDADVQVKNGWLQRSEENLRNPWDRGDWKVHSMSAITGRAHDYGLVVLTENNRVPEDEHPEAGWDYGMDTIESVAQAIHRNLYPGR
ncbi:serine hydrolase [Streptomyces sp. NPDC018833]|uniref:serine hydrolase n=1 Tax=Streptomyces sp. NPDC018833 TaxID=3365053 RepID=UPI0037A133C7